MAPSQTRSVEKMPLTIDVRRGSMFSQMLQEETIMSLGLILVIILVIALLGGFSGRFGGYGYGFRSRWRRCSRRRPDRGCRAAPHGPTLSRLA